MFWNAKEIHKNVDNFIIPDYSEFYVPTSLIMKWICVSCKQPQYVFLLISRLTRSLLS
jgi:hypothetical protein